MCVCVTCQVLLSFPGDSSIFQTVGGKWERASARVKVYYTRSFSSFLLPPSLRSPPLACDKRFLKPAGKAKTNTQGMHDNPKKQRKKHCTTAQSRRKKAFKAQSWVTKLIRETTMTVILTNLIVKPQVSHTIYYFPLALTSSASHIADHLAGKRTPCEDT